MADSHVMRKLCSDVFICPTCFHMVRNTPLEDRKFTVMIEGDTEVTHTIPEEPKEWTPIIILDKLNKLVEKAELQPDFYLDRKIPTFALSACTFLKEPIAIYNN